VIDHPTSATDERTVAQSLDAALISALYIEMGT